ncbi:ATP synthase subunit s, mitochondrial [Plakobranchus ocellatus]|uniref:ATP synthase subunit s, mitochondrial n=1 Tax=Plakobranchus ocellatus TaxID=259542 RepID=A0AAV4C820_9GAST|nr:ATP synthase subunit s, mitochondrial [Plakobranchus ocellatus]
MIKGYQLHTLSRRLPFRAKLSQYFQNTRRHLCAVAGCNIYSHASQLQFLSSNALELLQNQKRFFWGVDVAFNRVDEERVRLAGPDRAAAEWVLRNGGTIKWTTSSNHLNDYNMLPSTQFENYKLEEIDLTATDVIGIGFEHLRDLHYLKKIKLHGCRTVGDDGLSHLSFVADTLTDFEISRCPMITEKGLNHILSLKQLKVLVLYDLMEIRNLDTVVANLRKQMPGVAIKTKDPLLTDLGKEKH